MTLRELTDYYTALLAYEYRDQSNATRQTQILTKQAVADFFAGSLNSCFILDTAVGAQLDILGKYIGTTRNLGPGSVQPYFGLWTYASARSPTLYQGVWIPAAGSPSLPAASGGNAGFWYAIQVGGTSVSPIAATFAPGDVIFSDGTTWAKSTLDNANGLTDYLDSGVNLNGQVYSYFSADQNLSALTDSDYRQVLKFQVINNSSDNTLASIMGTLHKIFPGLIQLIDNRDMTMDYLVSSEFPLSQFLLAQFLPRPMGVGITVTIVPPSGGRLLTESGDSITTESGDHLVI